MQYSFAILLLGGACRLPGIIRPANLRLTALSDDEGEPRLTGHTPVASNSQLAD